MKKKFEKYTREWFAEMGRIGGLRTKELHGLKHFSRIAPKKGDKLKAEEKEAEK